MSFRFAYDRSFHPPAPVLPLRVSRPGGEASVLLPALVDTGADCTLVPADLAERLRLPALGRTVLEGVGGRAGSVTVHAATVELPGLVCLARVVAHGGEALIGRDLLARLAIRLDGQGEDLVVSTGRRRRGRRP